MHKFERQGPTEAADVAQIVRGILTIQARFAAQQQRPLGRGTHTKGVCLRAEFEVFDLRTTIGDPALAARLAKGIYARPGVYEATVRFANGASKLEQDSQRDVRALSFAMDVPAGILGPTAARLDYSMNDAPTFPINDTRSFAVFMRFACAQSTKDRIRVARSTSLRDLAGLLATSMRGERQKRKPTLAFQQMRYWSTVPFSHGPDDAVKYSAIPNADNPAEPFQSGPNFLRDELVRHVSEDGVMSSFDIALQFLDAERMRHWGIRKEPSFWIEGASLEWKEEQAPFHVVGRLRLLPGSILADKDCERHFIDVTTHATEESKPIGGINRARRAAEEASRGARLKGETAVPAFITPPTSEQAPPRRFGGVVVKIAAVLLAVIMVGVLLGILYYNREAARNIPAYEPVHAVRYLDQGWGPSRESPSRELYYYTPQGAPLHNLRYSWFLNLERPFRRARIAEPDYLRSLNFIVDPAPTPANPGQLPVGFARRYDDNVQDYVLDVTCSACHTGELHITRNGRRTALRIDGGQGMHAFTDSAFGHFVPELGLAIVTTAANPFKFNRFSNNVLGPAARMRDKARLWMDLLRVTDSLIAAQRGSFATRHYPVQEGFGRTDALARIANTVFGDHISPANYRAGDGPVNFPFLWNIWKFDWVQYGASVSQPMARNVGEAMGTGAMFGLVDDYKRPIPAGERYRTSISFDNLARLESTLQTLTPPHWPEDLLGPIDQAKAARGKQLYAQHCVSCHGPHVAADALRQRIAPLRLATDPLWIIRWKDVQDIGTDPATAMNFVNNTYDLSPTGLELEEVRALLKKELDAQKTRMADLAPALQKELARRKAEGADAATIAEIETQLNEAQYPLTDAAIAQKLDELDLKKVSSGLGLNILGLIIRDRYYKERRFSDEARGCFEGFGMLDLPQVVPGYKARPHEGVWATPPFLHNGSVPNLYELLSPVSERSKRFFVGRREFDPVKVGYVTEPVAGSTSGFWYDTSIAGNRNTGHEFRQGYIPFDESKPASAQYQGGAIGPALSHEERMDLVEYMKIHRDDPAPQPVRVPPDCFAMLTPSAQK
jgi:mono/diheme cytochrome c family protein